MAKIYIKKSNYWAIHDAFLLHNDARMQGTKLEALDRLIQNKGELINFSTGVIKCLNLGGGTFVAMEVTRLKKDSFFPCKIKKYHLQQL